MRPKNVVVMGKGSLAIKVVQWFLGKPSLYRVRYVLPVYPEPAWTDSLALFCNQQCVPVVATGDYRDVPSDVSVDLAVSVFYDKIIKEDFIHRCGKIINLHNSPLPHYRGVSPINWALKDCKTEHGVTIHEITPGIDDGPIISQLKYSIYPNLEEVEDVYKRALKYGELLFEETMPLLWDIVPQVQDEKQVIYHPSSDNHLLGERRFFTRDSS
jgi:methionyl-tRNA formyltransferase